MTTEELANFHRKILLARKSLPSLLQKRVRVFGQLIDQESAFCFCKMLLAALDDHAPEVLKPNQDEWYRLVEHGAIVEGKYHNATKLIDKLRETRDSLEEFWRIRFEQVLSQSEHSVIGHLRHRFALMLNEFAHEHEEEVDLAEDALSGVSRGVWIKLGVEPAYSMMERSEYDPVQMKQLANLVSLRQKEFSEYMTKYYLPRRRKEADKAKEKRWREMQIIPQNEQQVKSNDQSLEVDEFKAKWWGRFVEVDRLIHANTSNLVQVGKISLAFELEINRLPDEIREKVTKLRVQYGQWEEGKIESRIRKRCRKETMDLMDRAKRTGVHWGDLRPKIEKMTTLAAREEAFKIWEARLCEDLSRKIKDAAEEELIKLGLAQDVSDLVPESKLDSPDETERARKKISLNPSIKKIVTSSNQDPEILMFMTECENLGLQKKKTIPRETLYEIMYSIGGFSGSIDEFTTKCSAYAKGREYASRLKYSRKGSSLHKK